MAHINPIKDKDEVRELLARLKSIHAPEAKAHIELIEQFRRFVIGNARRRLDREVVRAYARELRRVGKKKEAQRWLGTLQRRGSN